MYTKINKLKVGQINTLRLGLLVIKQTSDAMQHVSRQKMPLKIVLETERTLFCFCKQNNKTFQKDIQRN